MIDITESVNLTEVTMNLIDVDNKMSSFRHTTNMLETPSTSSNQVKQRLLHFSVHFQDRIIQLEVPDTGTIGELKRLLHDRTGIPICQQLLSGWIRLPHSDAAVLSSLSLPRENILFLCVPNVADGITADDE